MSTKTNFKRIALVAVAALGLGVLTSVAPASASDEGLLVASNGGSSTTSRGIVSGEDDSNLTGTQNKFKMLSSGSLYVTANDLGAGSGANNLIVSGATITSCASADGVNLNSTGTVCLSDDEDDITATVKPNSGVTSFVIMQYDKAVSSLVNRITVSVVAASTVGVYSAADSCIYTYSEDQEDQWANDECIDSHYASGVLEGDTYAKSAPTTTIINGEHGSLYMALYDSNGNWLSSATTGITATATGGCTVGFNGLSSAVGTAATIVTNEADLQVAKISSTAPAKCVVTVSVNGAVVTTKTFTFLGEVTKLVVSDIIIAASASYNEDAFFVDAQDSAGNSIPGVEINNGGSIAGAVSTVYGATTYYQDGGTGVDIECADKGLAKDLKVKTSNDSATTIYSDAFSIQCSGGVANYTASLDKAVYSIGEVATLTITAKDSKGNLTYDGATLADNSSDNDAAKTAVSIAGGPLTQVGTITSSDSFTSGVKKYKFTVGGISTGSYNLVVDLPLYNSTLYSQAAVPVAYKVTTTADNGVQMNDVLKAIVSLIASINKQIAALQKALLKKK